MSDSVELDYKNSGNLYLFIVTEEHVSYNNLIGECDYELMKMYIHYSIVENI